MKSRRRFYWKLAAAAALLAAAALAAVCIGRSSISPGDVLSYLFLGIKNDRLIETVMWSVRIPRVLLAALVGAGLTVAGVAMQAMFGNPLVNTHILGVSSSAGFGAALW